MIRVLETTYTEVELAKQTGLSLIKIINRKAQGKRLYQILSPYQSKAETEGQWRLDYSTFTKSRRLLQYIKIILKMREQNTTKINYKGYLVSLEQLHRLSGIDIKDLKVKSDINIEKWVAYLKQDTKGLKSDQYINQRINKGKSKVRPVQRDTNKVSIKNRRKLNASENKLPDGAIIKYFKAPQGKQEAKHLNYKGYYYTIPQLAKLVQLTPNILYARLSKGLSGTALLAKTKRYQSIQYGGETISLVELNNLSGLAKSMIAKRYKQGKRGVELFEGVKYQGANKEKRVYRVKKIMIYFAGKPKSLGWISQHKGISLEVLHLAYLRGYIALSKLLGVLNVIGNDDNVLNQRITVVSKSYTLYALSVKTQIPLNVIIQRYQAGYGSIAIITPYQLNQVAYQEWVKDYKYLRYTNRLFSYIRTYVNTKQHANSTLVYKGNRPLTLLELSKYTGITLKTLQDRYKIGYRRSMLVKGKRIGIR